MSDLSEFPITKRWPPQHADRIQLYSLTTPNGVKISIALEELGQAFPSNKVMDLDFWLDQDRLFSDPQWALIREKAMIARGEMGLANARLQVNIEQGEVDDRGLQWMRIQTSIENG